LTIVPARGDKETLGRPVMTSLNPGPGADAGDMNSLDHRFSVAPMMEWTETAILSNVSSAAYATCVHRGSTLTPDAISCLGAFRPPAVGTSGDRVLSAAEYLQ
jgi:hypothetical protein